MAQLGLIGIGVMGSAFAQNLSEQGYDVALLDRNQAKIDETIAEAKQANLSGNLTGFVDVKAFVASLSAPRSILVLVPSHVLDIVIADLKPHLDAGDLIADLGNSNYVETERRVTDLEADGLQFLGMGISGGAEGARHGPSIMAGGSVASWDRVKAPLQAAAASFEGDPCCDWFGPGGSGHFIKMLHNGIEYADMQLLAEAYGMMRDGHGMDAHEIADVFQGWMNGPLNSYLTEIAGSVAGATDPKTGQAVLDIILDKAGQKRNWPVVSY